MGLRLKYQRDNVPSAWVWSAIDKSNLDLRPYQVINWYWRVQKDCNSLAQKLCFSNPSGKPTLHSCKRHIEFISDASVQASSTSAASLKT